MAVRKLSQRGVFGLNIELGKKFDLANIETSFAGVQLKDNASTVPSTGSIVEMYGSIESSIQNIESGLNGIIDDAAVNGAEVTWSIDKIMSFVASVDDSVVVGSIDERDAIADPHVTLVAFVMDTTGDTSLGDDEGAAASYIYTDSGWMLNAVLRGDLDVSNFLTVGSIVNDSTTGGADKPVSAEALKVLAEAVASSLGASDREIGVETLAVSNDQIVLSTEAVGDIIGGTVEILGTEGYLLVDATIGVDKKTITLEVDVANEFDGINGRVSFLRVV